MTKLFLIIFAFISLPVFASSKDYRENVKISGPSADVAYELALDTVEEIKSARYRDKLPYLKLCNLRPNQYSDNFFFRRKAWTKSSWVTLNHVTGQYTAIVKVSCTIRRDRD